jgi:hypothetical protein
MALQSDCFVQAADVVGTLEFRLLNTSGSPMLLMHRSVLSLVKGCKRKIEAVQPRSSSPSGMITSLAVQLDRQLTCPARALPSHARLIAYVRTRISVSLSKNSAVNYHWSSHIAAQRKDASFAAATCRLQ